MPVLLEMLDPENPAAAEQETHESGRDWKRLQVINTGIRGAQQLAEVNHDADLQPIRDALQRIVDSDLEQFGPRVRHGIRLSAEDALLTMQANSSASAPQ